MDKDELRRCIEEHSKSRPQISQDIGISNTTLGRWMNGDRKISGPDEKLLRLYFYGEVPVGFHFGGQMASKALAFTEEEWKIVVILSRRSGFSNPIDWIREKIRGYLENHPLAIEAKKEGGESKAPRNEKEGQDYPGRVQVSGGSLGNSETA